jgi:hypothetical protein
MLLKRKSSKQVKKVVLYHKSRKIVIGSKKVCVYVRVKDGVECVKRRSSSTGKISYRKLKSLLKALANKTKMAEKRRAVQKGGSADNEMEMEMDGGARRRRKVRRVKKGGSADNEMEMEMDGGARRRSRSSRSRSSSRSRHSPRVKLPVNGGACGCARVQAGGFTMGIPATLEGAVLEESNLIGGAKRLDKNNKSELYRKARKYDIKGRSKMSKQELVAAVRAAHKVVGERIRRRRGNRSKRSARSV